MAKDKEQMVFALAGKAAKVFRMIALAAQFRGETKIGEMNSGKKN